MRTITFAALINSLRNDADVSFLLGAGCSVSSGCPTGQGLVRLFKTELYCTDIGSRLEDVTSFDEAKRIIVDGLKNKDAKIRSKYEWLKTQYNKIYDDGIDARAPE